MEKSKSQINNTCAQCEPETMVIASLSNTNEQKAYTCITVQTVQIGELGKFTDVQIGERGKQRVDYTAFHFVSEYTLRLCLLHTYIVYGILILLQLINYCNKTKVPVQYSHQSTIIYNLKSSYKMLKCIQNL